MNGEQEHLEEAAGPQRGVPLNQDKRREAEILRRFVKVYCAHHGGGDPLCASCRDLLDYALQRLEKCPFDPKPRCKNCPVHCYRDDYRRQIREVMRFGGMYFIKRGRLDWLVKYLIPWPWRQARR